MGDVVQLPVGPRAPYFLLAWDQWANNCRVDFVHPSGAREYLGAGKDYLDVRDAARRCADQARMPLIDEIDPVKWMGARR